MFDKHVILFKNAMNTLYNSQKTGLFTVEIKIYWFAHLSEVFFSSPNLSCLSDRRPVMCAVRAVEAPWFVALVSALLHLLHQTISNQY